MFQVMAQTIRTATLMDVYDRTPPAAERAELARRQADALAAAARELQAEDVRRQAKARLYPGRAEGPRPGGRGPARGRGAPPGPAVRPPGAAPEPRLQVRDESRVR